MRLLELKEFDEITITEIAKEAGVVRMTLYRHFAEKEDILLYVFEENLDIALSIIEEKENPSLFDLLSFRFKTLKESPYTVMLSKHNQLSKLLKSFGKRNAYHFSNLLTGLNEIYIESFMVGGIDAMTELWIQNDMKEDPDLMAKKVLKILTLMK